MPQCTQDLNTLKKLSLDYQELNGTYYDTLEHPPSPVEFCRFVNIARPVIIKGFRVPAHQRWTDQYLIEKLEDALISVAVTPDGRADAITRADDGKLYFVEPYVEKLRIQDLLERLYDSDHPEASYLQSQNGNLYRFNALTVDTDSDTSEFSALRGDVPKDISWVSEALGRPPDAVNVWIGNDRSITSVHSDPYENLYTVIRGMKRFTLFPPTEGWCLKEKMYPHAMYTRRDDGSLTIVPSSSDPVRWSSIRDPADESSLPPEACPITIDIHAGDTLYLPAGWWHYVRQQDTTIAINWWYDFEPRGMNWVWLNFLRGGLDEVPDGNEDQVKDEM